MTMGGWTEGPQGRPEGKELGYHPKKKPSKWEPDYDAADKRIIFIATCAGLGICAFIGVVAAAISMLVR